MVETILYQEWKKLSMTGFWNFLSMYFRRDFDTLHPNDQFIPVRTQHLNDMSLQ